MKASRKQKKYVILVLGIVAILALGYTLLAPKADGGGLADTIETKKRMLSRQLETIELEGPYEVDLQQYNDRLQANRARLLEGDNPNVAESELMKVLTNFAENHGVQIAQKIVQKGEKLDGRLYKVTALIVAQCTSDQLVQLLTDIRNYDRYLTINELTIQTRTTRNQTSPEIRPSLTVSGYINTLETQTEESGPNARL